MVNIIHYNACLRLHFISHISKGTSGVNVFPVNNLRDVNQNQWLPMDKAVENVLLQSLMVGLDDLSLSDREGIVAVREDDGRELVLVVQEVAAMQVSDGNLVLTPEFEGAIERCLSTVLIYKVKTIIFLRFWLYE